MKRILLFASFFSLCLTLFACGSNSPSNPSGTQVNSQGSSAPVNLNKQMVTFQSKADDGKILNLVGYLYKPDGNGPFPTIIWNHGSETDAGEGENVDLLPVPFVEAGYAFFSPIRRGQGKSEGESITDTLNNFTGEEKGQKFVELMEGGQLNDQMAGLAYAKTLPFVDKDRLAVMGCSYGGIQTLMASKLDPATTGFKAAIAISPDAESWNNPAMQQHLTTEVAPKIAMPIYLLHPAKDVSIEPGLTLGRILNESQKTFELKIFPAFGDEHLQAHCFGGGLGTKIWAPDVLRFLDQVFHPS